MNPLDDLHIQALPNEQIVVSKSFRPSGDGEIAGITSSRFIAVSTTWPGPGLFGFTVPVESCHLIEYRTRIEPAQLFMGGLMILAGIGGAIWCFMMNASWIVYLPLLFLFFVGTPRLLTFRSTEICFHCDETETPLTWSFYIGCGDDKEHIVPKILAFAEARGIATSNFPNS